MKKYTFETILFHFANENTFFSSFSKPYTLYWNLYLIEDAQFIGNVDIRSETKDFKQCEIGYVIGEPFQNKGYATECVNDVINYMKNKFSTQTVYAKYFESNIASSRVLEKNGFEIISNRNGLVRVKKEL